MELKIKDLKITLQIFFIIFLRERMTGPPLLCCIKRIFKLFFLYFCFHTDLSKTSMRINALYIIPVLCCAVLLSIFLWKCNFEDPDRQEELTILRIQQQLDTFRAHFPQVATMKYIGEQNHDNTNVYFLCTHLLTPDVLLIEPATPPLQGDTTLAVFISADTLNSRMQDFNLIWRSQDNKFNYAVGVKR